MTWFDWLMYTLITCSLIGYSLIYMDEAVTKPMGVRIDMLEETVEGLEFRLDLIEERLGITVEDWKKRNEDLRQKREADLRKQPKR